MIAQQILICMLCLWLTDYESGWRRVGLVLAGAGMGVVAGFNAAAWVIERVGNA